MARDDQSWDELETAKRRWIVLFAGFTAVAGTINAGVALALGWPPWAPMLAVAAAALCLALAQRERVDAALLLLSCLSFALVSYLHLTSESADTAPYYLVPLVMLAMLFLPRRLQLPSLAVTMAGLLVMRWGHPFEDAYAASHTVDLVVVIAASAGVMWRARSGWAAAHHALADALARLQSAEQEQRRLREVAEQANRAKTRFLANMSHELRTPLNAVLGYAEMLAEGDLVDQDRRDALRIHAAGSHLLGIVDDVLDLARVESGGRTPVPTTFDLAELGEQLAQWLGPLVHSQRNHLHVDLPAVQLTTDRLMVRQILLNLLGNANKFCEHGSILLSGTIEDRSTVVLSVVDNGIGMTQAEQARVLQPFTQGNEEILVRYGGSGLGLSIVDRFATTLELASTAGVGTTFTVRLPADLGSDLAA